jgi:AcrR family transcriptional regulator
VAGRGRGARARDAPDGRRRAILRALAEIVAERGIGGLTLTDALARAGVTRRAFHGLFADIDEALLEAFDLGVTLAGERIAPAYSASVRWRDAIRPALAELLRFLDDEPALGRLCVLHSLSGGPPDLRRRRAEVQAQLCEIVDRGRGERAGNGAEPPAVVAEGVVGAVVAVVQARLLAQDAPDARERDSGPTIELFGALMSFIVLPYMGSSAARRELSRPPPPPCGAVAGPLGEVAGVGHEMRLTYRTRRVLEAIASYPGASNREIAERAGIVDQGQISKLLARLQRAGAIVNLGETPPRGAPNAWRLTKLGESVRHEVARREAARPGAKAGASASADAARRSR